MTDDKIMTLIIRAAVGRGWDFFDHNRNGKSVDFEVTADKKGLVILVRNGGETPFEYRPEDILCEREFAEAFFLNDDEGLANFLRIGRVDVRFDTAAEMVLPT